MTSRTCACAGCGSPTASRFARYCQRHKKHMVRHGHPQQRPLPATELKPYLKVVEALRQRDPSAPLWLLLSSRWEAIVENASTAANDSAHRPMREAAKLVLMTARGATADEVVDMVIAFFMLQRAQPHAFASDRGADFQLVRRVRNLAPTNKGTWISPTTGKPKHCYAHVSPRATEVLARALVDAFGMPALKLIRRLESEKDAKARERVAVSEAVDSLDITPKPNRVTTLVDATAVEREAVEIEAREAEAREIPAREHHPAAGH